MDNQLFATCSSGLCNRLLVLAGSLRIAERTGRQFALYWPVNADLGCPFEELFTNRFPMVTDIALTSILDTYVTVKIYNAWNTREALFKSIQPDGDPDADLVIIKGWGYPMFQGEGFSRELDLEIGRRLLSLIPSPEIQAAVDAFDLPPGTIGVHVRRGDRIDVFGQSRDEDFTAILRGIAERKPKVQLFVATDDPATERRLRDDFGDAVMTTPKTGSGRGDSRNAREALIDLLLLSRTAAIVGTVSSSFSQVAGLIGDKRMIVAHADSAVAHLDETCDALVACL